MYPREESFGSKNDGDTTTVCAVYARQRGGNASGYHPTPQKTGVGGDMVM